ncbi:heparan-alpha-glucosaminide N-acetyltransferase domain-containing protein [Microbacterium azadirachtae]|uniref:heparan-alpha-glucosaminide N-acetyltransferase domain-containing protein n=1 Tax=Microbacterium azadirachtae TaxID=582680 RepID=UPI003F755F20
MSTPSLGALARTRQSFFERWASFGQAPRLSGIDVARGLAVFGMIGVHVGVSASFDLADPLTWTTLVSGRSSILFAVVAGVSVGIAVGAGGRPTGEELRSARLKMVGRAIAVLALGLALELLGTEIAVILPIYGVLFLLITPFLGMRRRTLVVTAAALAVVGPTLVGTVNALTSSAGTGGSPGAPGVAFLLSGAYPLTVWLPLMLAGLALARCELGAVRTAARLALVGAILAVAGYGIGTAVNGVQNGWASDMAASSLDAQGSASVGGGTGKAGAGSASDPSAAFDPGSVLSSAWGVSPHSGGTFEIIGSGGFAIAVIGVCLLSARWIRVALVPIAAVGSMPLTAYTAHVLSFFVLSAPLSLAPNAFAESSNVPLSWLGCIGVLLVGCTIWALRRGRGPLERVTAWASRAMNAAPAPRERMGATGA